MERIMTITVAQLREELLKFRDDAICYPYEGEVVGLIISAPGESGGPGIIHCRAGNPETPVSEVHESVAVPKVK
jgi:hypothetical protein